ncbi:hypothetical protein C810_01374 [Lachnospiraceae bacterium A2]|nr:hypothetical protein C810_01374 [Lachnospiraceae bacterium A2]
MIFRNKDIKPEKSGYLICDDLLDTGLEPIPKELLENMPAPQRGNVISGTFGMFRASEFEKNVGGLKNV